MEQPFSWEKLESQHWARLKELRAIEDREIREESDREAHRLQNKLISLYNHRNKLTEQLQEARNTCNETETLVDAIPKKLEQKCRKVAIERKKQDEEHRRLFAKYRQGSHGAVKEATETEARPPLVSATNGTPAHGDGGINGAPPRPNAPPAREDQASDSPRLTAGTRSSAAIPSRPRRSPGSIMVELEDSRGNLIGEVRQIDSRNARVAASRGLPLKRARLAVRPNCLFTAADMNAIDDPSNQSVSKWLACMIQAKGEKQDGACSTCKEGAGPFAQCIKLAGPDFPSCGNCEWTHGTCRGATRGVAGESRPTDAHLAQPPAAHASLTGPPGTIRREQATSVFTPSSFTPTNSSTAYSWSSNMASQSAQPPQLQSQPQPQPQPQQQQQQPSSGSQSKQRQPLPNWKGDKQDRNGASLTPSHTPQRPGTPQPASSNENTPRLDAEPEDPELAEITKDTLTLQDDGMVFLEPEIMRGVPLAKITPNHAYWEPTWRPVEEVIQPKLEEWQAKLATLQRDNLNSTEKHARFLANRQVNRGKQVLAFLSTGDLHPYQIVGKQWVGEAGLTYYDSLHRLVATLEELQKFNTDLRPAQWLRQRLHEKYEANPLGFTLSKVLLQLYHDPKLTALRVKSGFGNIGRPSGFKFDKKSGKESKAGQAKGEKRKEPHTTPKTTPHNTPRKKSLKPQPAKVEKAVDIPPTAKLHEPPAAPSPPPHTSARKPRAPGVDKPGRSPAAKRRGSSAAGASVGSATRAGDMDFDGYTSTDSYSKDKIHELDWRVNQIKTPLMTSAKEVTQYWHWIGDEDIFEHQVLSDPKRGSRKTTAWGVYQEHIDFHIRMRELTEIAYAKDSPKVIVGTKKVEGVTYRGDVLADFKRDRTKRRFLAFMKDRGVKIVRKDADFIEKTWDEMDSEVLASADSDGS